MIYLIPSIASILFIGVINYAVGDGFLLVHDSSIYLNLASSKRDFLQLWVEGSYGHSNYMAMTLNFFSSIISYVGIRLFPTIKSFELAYYFLILNSIWYVSWYAIGKTCSLASLGESKWASLLASTFYTCNLYLICSWHGGTVESLWVVYLLCPPILYLSLKILSLQYTNIDLASMGLLCGVASYSGPFAFAVFICLGISFLIFWRGSFLELLRLTGICSIFGVIFGAPFIFLAVQTVINGDSLPSVNIYSLRTFSQNGLKGLFQFWFEWTMLERWRGRYFHSYIEYYKNPFITASAFMIWIAFFNTIIWFYKNSVNKIKYIGYLACIILIALFFAKANQAPLGVINLFFYKYLPVFMGVFRTPDTKFGIVVMAALSIGLAFFFLTVKNQVFKLLIYCCVFLQILMFFTPTPLVEEKSEKTFSRVIHVPDEYLSISHLINQDADSGSLLMLPPVQQAVFDYKNGYGLSGKDILGELVDRPVYYSDYSTYTRTKTKLASLMATPMDADFGELRIKYIFLRNDFIDGTPQDYDQLQSALRSNSSLKVVLETRLGTLFMVKKLTPHLIMRSNGTEILFDQKTSGLYSLKGDEFESQPIVLNNSYHPNWSMCNVEGGLFLYLQLLTCNKTSSKLYRDLSNKFSDFGTMTNAYIFYPPQIKFNLLLIFSSISILIFCIFLLVKRYAIK